MELLVIVIYYLTVNKDLGVVQTACQYKRKVLAGLDQV